MEGSLKKEELPGGPTESPLSVERWKLRWIFEKWVIFQRKGWKKKSWEEKHEQKWVGGGRETRDISRHADSPRGGGAGRM